MSRASERRAGATYADIEALPEHLVGEIVGGELIVSPRPASPHAYASSALGWTIGGPFHFDPNGPGGWWILFEPEVHLGADVLVPDLAGWRRERLPVVPNVKAFTLAPDWVCEVLSPSTAGVDRVQKMARYAAAEVGHAWLVEPSARTIEVYRRQEDTWLRVAAHAHEPEPVGLEPFEAMPFQLDILWLPEAPPAE